MIAVKLVPKTKVWNGENGPFIVLECTCGVAVDYPGHPDARTHVACDACETVWAIDEGAGS